MTDRLSALDVTFLYLETPTTPMHVGSVGVFEPPDGFDYDRLVSLVDQRMSLVPRYRQVVRHVPGHLAKPVWVDAQDFDIGYHVRRSALPRPGTPDQLAELIARLMSRRLDRDRPLWEMNFVEGLADGRLAVITKTHQALVDGISAVDIGQVILDVDKTPREVTELPWVPRREPGPVGLLAGALTELVSRPSAVVDTLRLGMMDAAATASSVVGAAAGLFAAVRTAARPAPESPLNVTIGEQRRFAMVRTDLADFKRIRARHGGTVNDAMLATIAGALRAWLLTRGEPVRSSSAIRAMVPVSIRAEGTDPDEDETAVAAANRVSTYLVDLPVGEPSPVIRLHQVSFAMQAHADAGQSVGASALIRVSGFAPPTLHALGAKAANGLSRRLFNLVVTNVPGPQYPLYAAGARMAEVYPVVPLARGQALAIGITSYDGGVFFGLNADRDAMSDVDVIADLVVESLAELVETTR